MRFLLSGIRNISALRRHRSHCRCSDRKVRDHRILADAFHVMPATHALSVFRCLRQHLNGELSTAMRISCLRNSGLRLQGEVMNRKRSSSCKPGMCSHIDAHRHTRSTSACSAAPISPFARIGSSTLLTASRMASRLHQCVIGIQIDCPGQAAAHPGRRYRARNTCVGVLSPAICCQISSAVKLSTGAKARTSICTMDTSRSARNGGRGCRPAWCTGDPW